MSNLIFIKDNDNNVGIGSNMINDIKGNINITQNLNVSGNVNITQNLSISQGRVGIGNGTNNPEGMLHIKDTGGTGHGLKIDGCPDDGSAQLYMLNANYGLAIKSNHHAGNYYFLKCYNSANNTGAIIMDNGRLGINKWDPKAPLHVAGQHQNGVTTGNTNMTRFKWYSASATLAQTVQHGTINGNTYLGSILDGNVWLPGRALYASSDSRIKTNIVDVPDNLALQQLRSIPCKYYEYIDKVERGTDQTIGFIAQEVKSILPMAVSEQKEIIPNVYKVINCIWNSVNDKFNMSSSDLSNVNGIVYKFYVSNESDGSDEKEIILTGNSDNTFTFDTQYTNVFCYGSEVDDFHTVDKQKLFTLNFSATQEIDRIQQTHITEIASLKAENTELKTKLNELTNKIKNATTFEDLKNSL